ncbi:hypothetical protein CLOP_g10879 [Closterium sp. NIES-67]|nr:hypothetical protein CLOP_g10879 [Closterium sp. NIES-67]
MQSSSSSSSGSSNRSFGAVELGAVHIFAPTWLNESALLHNHTGTLYGGTSPQGTQGLLQYFHLVETCIPMIKGYEHRQGVTFDWIVRTRVDTYWAAPLPPVLLPSPRFEAGQERSLPASASVPVVLDPAAYWVPYGSDFWGVNDRFGVGTWDTAEAAMGRLSMLERVMARGYDDLNSEKGLRAQLQVAGVRVGRLDVPFCVMSRRPYPDDDVLVAAVASTAPLNGAKCWPCTPKYSGIRALLKYPLIPSTRWIRSPSADWLNRPASPRGAVLLCDPTRPWEEGWPEVFDASVGSELAAMRRAIVNTSSEDCMRSFEEFKTLSEHWSAPPLAAICHRSLLGPLDLLGPPSASFYTATSALSPSSSVASTGPDSSSSSGSTSEDAQVGGGETWEEEVVRRVPGVAVVHSSLLDGIGSMHRHGPPVDVLKLNLDGSDLPTLASLIHQRTLPAACQLLVPFSTGQSESATWRSDVIAGLETEQVYLVACVQEWWSAVERCTFFSVPHCSSLLLGAEGWKQ